MMINKKAGPEFKYIFCLISGAVASMLLLYGCGLPRKQARTVHYYTLCYNAPRISGMKTTSVIRIEPPTVSAPYDSRRIVYSAGTAYQQAFYRYHMWAANPADMIFNLLARDIRQSGIAEAVITGPSGIAPAYAIEIVITKFYEKDEKKSWSAVLCLTARLIKENPAGPAKFIFEKTYRQTKKLDHKNPVSLARAMSQCLSEISGRMIKDIYTNLI